MVVIGAGHVGKAVVELGQMLSWRFLLVDDRPEFLAAFSSNPTVQTLLANPDELANHLVPNDGVAVVLASRNHELDGRYLETILKSELDQGQPFGFVGALGSRAKSARLRRQISALGDDFAQRLISVRMPVGLDVAAETPHEIALSVLAEAMAALRGVTPLADEEGRPTALPLHSARAQTPDEKIQGKEK